MYNSLQQSIELYTHIKRYMYTVNGVIIFGVHAIHSVALFGITK